MRDRFDFSPYRRSAIGFDRLFDVLENAARQNGNDNYPPFDIERQGDDQFRITLAVAGFTEAEIELTAQQNLLIVTGRKQDGDEGRHFIHRGIALRAFERRFELADYVQVKDARLEHGLLTIELVREVPEAMKPRRVSINGQTPQPTLEAVRNDREAA